MEKRLRQDIADSIRKELEPLTKHCLSNEEMFEAAFLLTNFAKILLQMKKEANGNL